MKRLLFLLLIFISPFIYAGSGNDGEKAGLFTYDRQKVDDAFAGLNEGSLLIDSLKTQSKSKSVSEFEFANMDAFEFGIAGGVASVCGSFTFLGILAGPAAILYVYLETDKNNEETKQALLGCLLGGAIGIGVGILVYLAYLAVVIGGIGCCGLYYGI